MEKLQDINTEEAYSMCYPWGKEEGDVCKNRTERDKQEIVKNGEGKEEKREGT